MDLMAIVMEARKGASSGITVSADPKKDKDIQANDYTGEEVDDGGNDTTDTDQEDTDATDYSAGTPEVDEGGRDTSSGNEPTGDDDTGTDYGEGAPEPDEPTGDEGGDQSAADQGENDAGTDYSEGAPEPGGDGEEDAAGGQDETEGADTETGNEATPEEGSEGANDAGEAGTEEPAEGEDVTATTGEEDAGLVDQKFDDANKASAKVFLLRNYIKLLRVISRFSKKLSESRKSSLLSTATCSQVAQNLSETKDILYKYILHSYDAASYELNLYNYNLFFEILQWNVEMIRKVNDIEERTKEAKKK